MMNRDIDFLMHSYQLKNDTIYDKYAKNRNKMHLRFLSSMLLAYLPGSTKNL